MRLRVSGEHTGKDYDLGAVTGTDSVDAAIPHGDLLVAFAEAIYARDDEQTADKRRRILDALGEAALVDAAAVIASFNAFPRVADATGIPLETEKAEITSGMRDELGLNAFDIAGVG